MKDIMQYIDKEIKQEEALGLYNLSGLSLMELFAAANKTREKYYGNKLSTCTISNAKCGKCEENCKFCAQSAHYNTNINGYPMKTIEELTNELEAAHKIGSENFGIVTSGRSIERGTKEFEVLKDFYVKNAKKGIKTCASIGNLSYEAALELKNFGLTRYHNNLQTSTESYAKIVATTHTVQDRIDSIKNAKKAGLKVCSGGIIGMGETNNDRISMAFTLKELDVDCVPLNMLNPIKGTPMENRPIISIDEVLKTIAIYRLILKDKSIKVTAGRESILKDFMGMAFMVGADSMMIGGYLTVKGRSVQEDKILIDNIKNLWRDKIE